MLKSDLRERNVQLKEIEMDLYGLLKLTSSKIKISEVRNPIN